MIENCRRWEDVNHPIISLQSKGQICSDVNKHVYSTKIFTNLGVDFESIAAEKKSDFVLTPFLNDEMSTFLAVKQVCGEVNLK